MLNHKVEFYIGDILLKSKNENFLTVSKSQLTDFFIEYGINFKFIQPHKKRRDLVKNRYDIIIYKWQLIGYLLFYFHYLEFY